VTTKKASAIETGPLPDLRDGERDGTAVEMSPLITPEDIEMLTLLADLFDEHAAAVAPDDEARFARETLARGDNEEG
jgi:hypothetical protein